MEVKKREPTFESSWMEKLAWRKKCKPKEWPPPRQVQNVYLSIKKLLAERDRAHAELNQLSQSHLTNDAYDQLETKGGMEWLEAEMTAAGCRVRPSNEFRQRILDPDGTRGWESTKDPVERRLTDRALSGDQVASAVLEMYWYEELKDYFVSFATMCRLLQVNPESSETTTIFTCWHNIRMLEMLIEELELTDT